MTEKTYKNKNMIRTKHNVGRMIYFESILERERFIKLYEDLFDSLYRSEDDYEIRLFITLTKKNFEIIKEGVGLINVKTKSKKTRYWRTEKAVV